MAKGKGGGGTPPKTEIKLTLGGVTQSATHFIIRFKIRASKNGALITGTDVVISKGIDEVDRISSVSVVDFIHEYKGELLSESGKTIALVVSLTDGSDAEATLNVPLKATTLATSTCAPGATGKPATPAADELDLFGEKVSKTHAMLAVVALGVVGITGAACTILGKNLLTEPSYYLVLAIILGISAYKWYDGKPGIEPVKTGLKISLVFMIGLIFIRACHPGASLKDLKSEEKREEKRVVYLPPPPPPPEVFENCKKYRFGDGPIDFRLKAREKSGCIIVSDPIYSVDRNLHSEGDHNIIKDPQSNKFKIQALDTDVVVTLTITKS